jgi:hypothetical protein
MSDFPCCDAGEHVAPPAPDPDAEFTALAEKEAAHRILGGSDFAANMRRQMVEMAEWARGIVEVREWAQERMDVDDWKQAASNFPPHVPVDERVVALVRLPISVTAIYEVSTALDKHLGPDLVFRTDTGIQGWAVLARPATTEGVPA